MDATIGVATSSPSTAAFSAKPRTDPREIAMANCCCSVAPKFEIKSRFSKRVNQFDGPLRVFWREENRTTFFEFQHYYCLIYMTSYRVH